MDYDEPVGPAPHIERFCTRGERTPAQIKRADLVAAILRHETTPAEARQTMRNWAQLGDLRRPKEV